jgi:hypothetical protein
MEAPRPVQRNHWLAAAVQIEGLGRQPGRGSSHSKQAHPAKHQGKAHEAFPSGEAMKRGLMLTQGGQPVRESFFWTAQPLSDRDQDN